jgi:hypothetical protein
MKNAEAKRLSFLGSLEYSESDGEPGIVVDRRWYGALPLVDSVLSMINPEMLKDKIDEFRERQRLSPVQFDQEQPLVELWAYRDKVVKHDLTKLSAKVNPEDTALLVKHCVLSREADMEKVRRQVQAFENFEKVPAARREIIPQEVQMFVWQRDQGKCRECGSDRQLEFDHIIPVIEGGSSTARNVQLLCEPCNRRKGRTV